MAASGTKRGRTKWKPVDTSQIISPDVNRKLTTSSWADESNNDLDDNYDFGRKPDVKVTLPTAPRAARGAENDANIPKEPPFQAYLSNLSYDVTEDDLAAFFSNLRVKSVRLPRDDRSNTFKAKGFGYVEFEDRMSLIEALSMPDTTCKNRRMRIEVADNGDQGRGSRGGQRDRGPNEPDRTMGDWRSGPRTEADPSSDKDGYRSGPRREYGSDRGGGGMYGDRRGGGFRDDDRDRGGFRRGEGDRPNYRDNRGNFRDDRGGGYRDDRGGNYRDDRGSNFRDSGNGSDRYDKRSFDDRRGGDYGGGDNRGTWRKDPDPRMEQKSERDVAPPPVKSETKTRTRLNLQPRSKPIEEIGNSNDTPPPVPTVQPSATAIFGGARPVDTAAREREIEERLAKQREDRLPPPRDENKVVAATQPNAARDPLPLDDSPSINSCLEPAPPPRENFWARRSQPSAIPMDDNISTLEDGVTPPAHGDASSTSELNQYQLPRGTSSQDDTRRDERSLSAGSGAYRNGGHNNNIDTKPVSPAKSSEKKDESSEETIRMPRVEDNSPSFVASNKFAYLGDSESEED